MVLVRRIIRSLISNSKVLSLISDRGLVYTKLSFTDRQESKRKIRIPKAVYTYALKEAKLIAESTGEPVEKVLPRVLESEAVKKYMKAYTEYVEIEL